MRNKLFFYEKLSSHVNAGLDIRKSLDITASQEKGKTGALIRNISGDIASGGTLAESLSKHRDQFTNFEIALVRSGELTGNLSENLHSLAEHFRKTFKWKRKFATGLIYPVLLFHLAILLPPVYVLIMKGMISYLGIIYKPLLLVYSAALAVFMFHKLIKLSPMLSSASERFIWAVPIAGKAAKNIAVSRFLTSLALSLKAGMAADKSLHISLDCASSALTGSINPEPLFSEGITGVIRNSRILHKSYTDIIQTGENSGAIEDSLLYVSSILESEAETIIERTAIILPVIIYLAAALYIAVIIIGFYANLYNSFPLF